MSGRLYDGDRTLTVPTDSAYRLRMPLDTNAFMRERIFVPRRLQTRLPVLRLLAVLLTVVRRLPVSADREL
jgi:hypothetical protein